MTLCQSVKLCPHDQSQLRLRSYEGEILGFVQRSAVAPALLTEQWEDQHSGLYVSFQHKHIYTLALTQGRLSHKHSTAPSGLLLTWRSCGLFCKQVKGALQYFAFNRGSLYLLTYLKPRPSPGRAPAPLPEGVSAPLPADLVQNVRLSPRLCCLFYRSLSHCCERLTLLVMEVNLTNLCVLFSISPTFCSTLPVPAYLPLPVSTRSFLSLSVRHVLLPDVCYFSSTCFCHYFPDLEICNCA